MTEIWPTIHAHTTTKKRRGYWRSEQLCLIIYLFKYNYIYRRIFICVRAFGFVPLL